MKDNKLSKKEKLRLAKVICDEELKVINFAGKLKLSYDHYSPEVHTIYIREHRDSPRRVKHTDIKCIADRIKEEVDPRWNTGLIVNRPELFAWYVGEDDNDELSKPEPLF
jgi:hypothetical protein